MVEAIKQKYICHPNNCLSDLFYLDIQKYLIFEVFTSNTVTVEQANKTRNFWDEYTEHASISYYFLIQYVLSS